MMQNNREQANKRTLKKGILIALGMLGFAYALVPLYGLICDITGLNGKTGRLEKEQALATRLDESRKITVIFDATLNAEMPWEFRPVQKKMVVSPGEIGQAAYFAKNMTSDNMVGQAVPSVAPSKAAKYFNKTECFCFSNQPLAPNEGKEMPLRFIIDPDLPKDVTTITLSYTFFEMKDKVAMTTR